MARENIESFAGVVQILSYIRQDDFWESICDFTGPTGFGGYSWRILRNLGTCWLYIDITGSGRFEEARQIWEPVVTSIHVKRGL